MSKGKASHEEVKSWYRSVHSEAAGHAEDNLTPVIHPSEGALVNRATDYGHRLGMRHIFRSLIQHKVQFRNLRVVDVGSGTGRWVEKFASLGCSVTGVEMSPEAVERLRQRFPQSQFICSDLCDLQLARGSADLINSVTVIQHIHALRQAQVIATLSQALRPGGYFTMLENTCDFSARHVFPHTPDEWKAMFESTGLTCVGSWSCSYEFPLRRVAAMRNKPGTLQEHSEYREMPAVSIQRSSALKRAAKSMLALSAFPFEWIQHQLKASGGSHVAMVFRKPD